jgi:hypothetical protein
VEVKLPRMTDTERAVFAACYGHALQRRSATDNSAHEGALDAALWDLECFRQAVRERKP